MRQGRRGTKWFRACFFGGAALTRGAVVASLARLEQRRFCLEM